MIINNVKFLGSRLMPNPIEVDYWIDTRSDPYGSVIKYYNGTDWVLLNTGGGNGGNTDLTNYYTKSEVDTRLSSKADIIYVNSQVLSVDLTKADKSSVYTKDEVNSIVGSIPVFNESKYYTKVDIDNKGYLTSIPVEYVTEQVLNDSIKSFVTLDTVYSKTEIDDKFNNLPEQGQIDLTGYATELWVKEYTYDKATADQKLMDAIAANNVEEVIVSDTEPTEDVDIWIDLSSTETESVVRDAPADGKVYGRQDNTWIEVVSEEPDLSNYYTKEESSSVYATKEELNTHATEAREYTDTVITNLVNAAPDTLDTLGELAQAILDNEDVVELLESSVTNKLDKTEAEQIYATKDDVTFIEVIKDGVYAVTIDDKLVDYNTADKSCVSVAIIAGEHAFAIKHHDNYCETYVTEYFIMRNKDNELPNYNTADGSTSSGTLGYELSVDHTTWTDGALSDFSNGKRFVAKLHAYSSEYVDDQEEDGWYVPAMGLLALMFIYKNEIDAMLDKIGCGPFKIDNESYWSSSEYSEGSAWKLNFNTGNVYSALKNDRSKVRLIRTINTTNTRVPLKDKISQIESTVPTKVSQLENDNNYVYNSNSLINDIQVVSTLPESPISTTLYLIPE